MYNNSLSHYQKVEVETTDSLKLIIMLYEGGISFLEQAKLRIKENKVADKGILISKVMAIVSELQSSLDLKKGGEVAGNIDRIYSYLRERLIEANLKSDEKIVDEVLHHMRTLKEAWVQVRNKEQNLEQPEAGSEKSQKQPTSDRYDSSQSGRSQVASMAQANLQAVEFIG